jgi:hypothetical protein
MTRGSDQPDQEGAHVIIKRGQGYSTLQHANPGHSTVLEYNTVSRRYQTYFPSYLRNSSGALNNRHPLDYNNMLFGYN